MKINKNFNYEKFGKAVYKRRKELGLTQEALGKKVEIGNAYISRMERGKAGRVTLGTAMRLLVHGLDFDVGKLSEPKFWKDTEAE